MPGGWAIGVDIGGTFTDVVCAGGGRLIAFKLPTTTGDQSRAVAEALARLGEAHDIPAAAVARFTHGTTVATNAVLERKGARIALITTEGFGDTLEIGRQMRRQLYDLALRPETPGWLAPGARRFELRERVGADGAIVEPLDPASLSATVEGALGCGAEAVAVCLLFSFADPAHERAVADALEAAAPDLPVSLSSEVDPAFREYERTVATCFDAYVKPVVDGYLARMETALAEAGVAAPLQVMQSRGGLMAATTARRRPIRLFLSGPAAGVIGACDAAAREGLSDIVSIDIGGTSSDIALAEGGEAATRPEADIGGYAVRAPMLDIVTLGAGGGSVAWLDAAGGLRVGPHSAGAEPGPACYGRGGTEPTVTDASIVLGYLDPAYFAGGALTLDPDLAREAVERALARPLGLSVEDAAAGVHRIANAQMADGIRLVSVNRGVDPRGLALVALGGAGGVHAAALAEELRIGTVLIPQRPGVLSAAGLLAAPIEHEMSGPFHRRLAETTPQDIAAALAPLDAAAEALMAREAADGLPRERRALADMAYVGQSHALETRYDPDAVDPCAALYAGFEAAHRRIHGHATGAPAQIVNLRVVLRAQPPNPLAAVAAEAETGPSLKGTRRVAFPGAGAVEAAVHARARIAPGDRVPGPAVIEQADTTTLVPPGWTAEGRESGALRLKPQGVAP
jgi:N-methylhydantoinase A